MSTKIKHYSIARLKKDILKIFGKYLDLKSHHVFFFGSRVSGKGTDRSDIDIGIEGPKEIPFTALAKIRDEVGNLPLLYKIEIVDFKKVSDDFRKVALKSIELLTK